MDIQRIFRHLMMTEWEVRRAFPTAALTAIRSAIEASEMGHVGEIRFAVEGALHSASLFRGQTARERAVEVFSELHMWDTEYNSGVLIYLLLADRAVEIIADRGVHEKVGTHGWKAICRDMETAMGQAKYKDGVLSGVEGVAQHLAKCFPVNGEPLNELPNQPMVLKHNR